LRKRGKRNTQKGVDLSIWKVVGKYSSSTGNKVNETFYVLYYFIMIEWREVCLIVYYFYGTRSYYC